MENTVWDIYLLPNASTVKDGEIYFVAKPAKYFKNINNSWKDVTNDVMSGEPIRKFIEFHNMIKKRGINVS